MSGKLFGGRIGGKKLLVALVLLAAGVVWASQRGTKPAGPEPKALAEALESTSEPAGGTTAANAAAAPRVVPIASVTQASTSTPTAVTGTVEATLKSDVSAKIMGRVTQVLVREGQRVGAGQTLVRLESADLQAAVAQAQAALRSADEAVKQARTGAQIQVTQSSTRVEQAKAALDAARQNLSMVTEGPRKQQKLQADAGVQEAQAGLAQAQATLSLVREGARRQQKLQAQQGVLQAEAQYRTAKVTYERYKKLYEQEVIAAQQFDEVKMQYDNAAAQLEIAKQQASMVDEGARPQEVLSAEEAVRQAEARVRAAKEQRDLAHEGGREQEIAAARAQVQQAEQALRMAQAATAETTIKRDNISLLLAQRDQAAAALRAAQVQATYATISAPFAGVVTARRVDPGAMAAPGAPLIRIEDANAFRLECTVPEAQIAGIHLGMSVPVSLDSLQWSGTGRVAEVVPSADPSSRTFLVKIGIQAVPHLASGVFGKAMLFGPARQQLVVPASAIVRRGELESVMAVDEKGVAHLRLVRTGDTANGKTEILSGVQAGDRVVASGAEDVADGAAVRAQ